MNWSEIGQYTLGGIGQVQKKPSTFFGVELERNIFLAAANILAEA